MIRLVSGDAIAEFDLVGAEPKRWFAGGKERLWTPSPEYWWPDIAPNLFPICGAVRDATIQVDGIAYPMPIHGFAPTMPFELVEQSADRAVFRLEDNADTRKHYPFAFRLDVVYTLSADALREELVVTNRGDVPLPYAVGVHPGFATGVLEQNVWTLRFDEQEADRVPTIATGGIFTSETRSVPFEGKKLPLSSEIFAPGAFCFLDAASKGVALVDETGGGVRVLLEDMPHIVLWTKPGAPYVCIEGWTGHGDPAGFEGDLKDKPSMRFLDRGASATHAATYTIL